jgi:hypothetical protein
MKKQMPWQGKGLQNHFLGLNQYSESLKPQSISAWIVLQRQIHWTNVAGYRQSKLMMGKPSQSLSADVLQLSRTQIRVVTRLRRVTAI